MIGALGALLMDVEKHCVTFGLDLRRYIGLPRFLFSSSLHRSPCTIQSGSISSSISCMIWSRGSLLYDINLGATHTTILSTRGVEIPIYLVSSTTDSIWQRVVLFEACTLLDLDLKSEFLCQLILCCTEPADPPEPTSYAWDISQALIHHISPIHS